VQISDANRGTAALTGALDQLVFSHLRGIIAAEVEPRFEKDHGSVLARLWRQLGDKRIVAQEAAQAIFIGNESLLSNLTCLLHLMIQNPECIARLREELETLDVGTYGHQIWRDPKVMQLPYLVSHPKDHSWREFLVNWASFRMLSVASLPALAPPLGTDSLAWQLDQSTTRAP
jgi:hypothetical protein